MSGTSTRARLDEYRSGTGRYSGKVKAARDEAREILGKARAEAEAIRLRAIDEARQRKRIEEEAAAKLRAEREHNSRPLSSIERKAALALDSVYGSPVGSAEVVAGVSLALKLRRAGAKPKEAMRGAALQTSVSSDDIAAGIMAMRGARS